MKSTLIDITGKLNTGLVELYSGVAQRAEELQIEFLVVGAMARDLVLVHGFNSKIERGTKDVDFAINVSSWKEFESLRSRLLNSGYKEDPKIVHKLHYTCSDDMPWEIDIVPFGGIEDARSNIAWPPDQSYEMSVLGFKEAEQHAINVQISNEPKTVVKVASPAGMSVLKLISWLGRDSSTRKKDAGDIRYLIESYTKIPEIYDAVYDDGQMKAQEFDEVKSSAMKLGLDAAEIASAETKKFLTEKLFDDADKFELLIREMVSKSAISMDKCESWMKIYIEELTKAK